MYQLDISPQVYFDLHEIKSYISKELNNQQAAIDLIEQIINKIKTLTDFPYSGSPLNALIDIKTDYRFLICKNYLIFYRVEQNDIFVSRVLYKRRDYIKLLFSNKYNNDNNEDKWV